MKNLTIVLIISIIFLSGCTTFHIKKGDVEAHYMSTKDINNLEASYNADTKDFTLKVGEANASSGQKALFDSVTQTIDSMTGMGFIDSIVKKE